MFDKLKERIEEFKEKQREKKVNELLRLKEKKVKMLEGQMIDDALKRERDEIGLLRKKKLETALGKIGVDVDLSKKDESGMKSKMREKGYFDLKVKPIEDDERFDLKQRSFCDDDFFKEKKGGKRK